ncbi:hypothetical protein ACTFIZ_010353 [Dictyostelium cf. discoideum]
MDNIIKEIYNVINTNNNNNNNIAFKDLNNFFNKNLKNQKNQKNQNNSNNSINNNNKILKENLLILIPQLIKLYNILIYNNYQIKLYLYNYQEYKKKKLLNYQMNLEISKTIQFFDFFNILDHPISSIQINLEKFNLHHFYGSDIKRYHSTIECGDKYIFPKIQSSLVIDGIIKNISPFHLLDHNLNIFTGKSPKIIIICNSPTNYLFPCTYQNLLLGTQDESFQYEVGEILFTNVCPIIHCKDNNYLAPQNEFGNLMFLSILNCLLSRPSIIITSGYYSDKQFGIALSKIPNLKLQDNSILIGSNKIQIFKIPHLSCGKINKIDPVTPLKNILKQFFRSNARLKRLIDFGINSLKRFKEIKKKLRSIKISKNVIIRIN